MRRTALDICRNGKTAENEEKYKQMFLDYYLNGIKQRQLADKYGLSQAQVSRKLKTIIKSLQELLKDYY